MNTSPDIEPLPYKQRKFIFRSLVFLFLLALPVVMFYTNGYRFDFSNDTTQIVSTGGLFVSIDNRDADLYINDELERDVRIFRQATYVQNLEAGVHQVHVQLDQSHTWVKKMPIYAHIVTEVSAFTFPTVPQVRIITEYQSDNGNGVAFLFSTSTPFFTHASSTNIVEATTTTATTSYTINAEYQVLQRLFSTTSSSTSDRLIDIVAQEIDEAFTFSSATTSASSTVVATTTKKESDVELYEKGNEVYARFVGERNDIPSYYCVSYTSASTTVREYGEHVSIDIENILRNTSLESVIDNGKVCRDHIKLDRKQQVVSSFDFVPNSTDLVLLTLEDGVYVGEIDDRGWQNTQLLYRGAGLTTIVEGGRIYIKDGSYYLEVFTEIQ